MCLLRVCACGGCRDTSVADAAGDTVRLQFLSQWSILKALKHTNIPSLVGLVKAPRRQMGIVLDVGGRSLVDVRESKQGSHPEGRAAGGRSHSQCRSTAATAEHAQTHTHECVRACKHLPTSTRTFKRAAALAESRWNPRTTPEPTVRCAHPFARICAHTPSPFQPARGYRCTPVLKPLLAPTGTLSTCMWGKEETGRRGGGVWRATVQVE
eukprot:GHVU01078901.1.p1 GENE.GHVU01078901.1~~GHVU01078901.1.p1  ORF type:complete len:211 (+),score=7.43 GHVU01078901.1:345-977(+)